ncbi:hypothetical protein GOP47_0000427 [Adiantum capillus-veneris]|uniref:Uncharacterized protein n=1 Tax=Adiantum capillus-veneris TaxID=13818 RepID=A0A9D4VEY9_ADICA|nr:hypothetical protein GOP47_0000427 [Adiantum capillus-veneris]
MQTAKHTAATAKEKMGNTTAKAEEKMDTAKASTQEKLDKVMAHDKPGREAAHERKEAKEAEAKEMKHEKKAENISETKNMRADIDRQHAAAKTPNSTGPAAVTDPSYTNAPRGANYGYTKVNYGNDPLATTGDNANATGYATAGAPAPTIPANTPAM